MEQNESESNPLVQPDLFKPTLEQCTQAIGLLLKAEHKVIVAAAASYSYWDRQPLANLLEYDAPQGWGA